MLARGGQNHLRARRAYYLAAREENFYLEGSFPWGLTVEDKSAPEGRHGFCEIVGSLQLWDLSCCWRVGDATFTERMYYWLRNDNFK